MLPFTYLAAEDSADYFSVGMTDELLTRLSQIEGLPVIARTSVMQYRETEKTIPEIGRELGVRRIVEGSVQQVGRRVRIQAQLVDARTGQHLWAQGFTRPFEDVLQLQSEIAWEIAAALELELLPAARRQLAAAPAVDSAAYALYLQGRALRFQETRASVTEAIRLLRRSIAIDSTFAPAWAVLSLAAWFVPAVGGTVPGDIEGDSLARAAARRAVALDPRSAEAQIAMGNVREALDLNFPAAGPHFKRAVELNPGLADAHREYGLYLSRMRQFEAAERYLRKAANLDPASPAPWQALGWNALYRGNYRQAKSHLHEALTLQPSHRLALTTLAEVYLAQDSLKAALRILRRQADTDPSPWTLGPLGQAYAEAGWRDSALVVAERIRREFGPTPRLETSAYGVFRSEATVHAALGQTTQALDLLEQARVLLWLKVDPAFKSLREEPRFERLLEKIGLDDASVRQTMEKLGEGPSRGNLL